MSSRFSARRAIRDPAGVRSMLTFLLALGVHALIFAVVARAPSPRAPRALAPSPSLLEIDVLAERTAASPSQASAPAIAPPSQLGAVAARSIPSSASNAPMAAAPEGDPAFAVLSTNDAGTEAPWRAPVENSPSLAQLALAGPNRFLVAPPNDGKTQARDERTALAARVNEVLRAPLEAADSARGLGPEGPALRRLEEEAYADAVPRVGRALFELRVGADGKVLGLALLESNGARDVWGAVAERSAKALEGTMLRPPPSKRAVVVRIAVDARVALPSGADPGLDMSVAGIPLSHGEGPQSTKVDILNPLKPGNVLTVMGDPADIAARPRTVVHAHVVDQRPL